MVKNPPAVQETRVQSSGSGRSPGRGNGNPLQYSCLESSMNRGPQWVTVHGVAKNQNNTSEMEVSRGRGDSPQAADKKPLGRTEPWHLSCPTTTLKDAMWYQDPHSSELSSELISELGCKRKRKEGGRKKGRKKRMEGTKERMERRKRKGKKGGRKTENINSFIIGTDLPVYSRGCSCLVYLDHAQFNSVLLSKMKISKRSVLEVTSKASVTPCFLF